MNGTPRYLCTSVASAFRVAGKVTEMLDPVQEATEACLLQISIGCFAKNTVVFNSPKPHISFSSFCISLQCSRTRTPFHTRSKF